MLREGEAGDGGPVLLRPALTSGCRAGKNDEEVGYDAVDVADDKGREEVRLEDDDADGKEKPPRGGVVLLLMLVLLLLSFILLLLKGICMGCVGALSETWANICCC